MNETIFIIIVIAVMVTILIMASMMYKKKKVAGQKLVLGTDNQFEITDGNKMAMSTELEQEVVQKDFPLTFEFSQVRDVQFANQCPPKMYMFENNGGYFCCKTHPSCQVIDMYGNKKCGCSTDICSLTTKNTQGNQLCYSNLYVE